MSGRDVRSLMNRNERPGTYCIVWDEKEDRGKPVASGLYLCRLPRGTQTLMRKAVLLR
ncbi:MAG: hypothetical protein MIO92_06220 [Methanosarcinaceae archaeon]|nr:hypothetical protein [Methanosarcinaceae archaeon]